MKKIYVFTALFCLVAEQSMASSPVVELMKDQPRVVRADVGDLLFAILVVFAVLAFFGLVIAGFTPKRKEDNSHGHGHHGHDSHGGHENHRVSHHHDNHSHSHGASHDHDSHNQSHSNHGPSH